MNRILSLSVILYRFGIPFIPRVLMNLNRFLFSCSIPYTVKFGKKVKFGHSGLGVVINSNVKIGDNCLIGTNVTIGGSNKNPVVPVLGNNVYVATGAKLIGAITIGNNVVVAANAVVTKNVPDNVLVAGVPAKIIKNNIDITKYI
jgi:serine O-acetyltransferase